MGPSVHSVQINGHYFPKYVWDDNLQNVGSPHKSLVSTITANFQ